MAFNFMTIPMDALAEYQTAVAYYRDPSKPTMQLQLAGATAKLLADFNVSPAVAQVVATDFAIAVEALGGGDVSGQALTALQALAASKGITLPAFVWGILGTVLEEAEAALASKTQGKL